MHILISFIELKEQNIFFAKLRQQRKHVLHVKGIFLGFTLSFK